MSGAHKAIVSRFCKQLDKKNLGIFFELCSPDQVAHFPGGPQGDKS